MAGIPIWPGSGSAISGSTPFGFYDGDTQYQTDGPRFAKWAACRLGYPIMDVELQEDNFYCAFEESVTEYSKQVNEYRIADDLINLQGQSTGSNLTHKRITPNFSNLVTISEEYGTEALVGGTIKLKKHAISIISQQQDYDLNKLIASSSEGGNAIEIKRVFFQDAPAVARYFDPFVGTGLGSSQMLDTFGWGAFSVGVSFIMTPVYSDILRLQAIEFNDKVRKASFSFEIHNNKLRIFPRPTANYTAYVEYIVKSERGDPVRIESGSGHGVISDHSTVPFNNMVYSQINDVGKHWIRRYGLALSKETLGLIRSKYSVLPIPGAETTLDGETLRAEAANEQELLLTELKEMLDKLSRRSQLEKEADEAENLSRKWDKVPLPIYVK